MTSSSLPYASLLLMAALPGALQADAFDAPEIPVFYQDLAVEGAPVEVAIAPLYEDKGWAFTTRWDDNNLNALNMHAAMAEIGLEGSFYLNGSRGDTGTAFAQELSTDGCSVGGHTTNHYFLTTLNANTILDEILFNRIERETDTDTPVTTFAFPFGNYRDPADPEAQERITQAWLRSGYHGCVYEGFILSNPSMPAGYASTVNQVKPGDRKIEAKKFRTQMDNILSHPDKYRTKTPVISVGVHPWQSAQELEKFKPLLAEYMGRDDFWYANQTEIAAYLFQAAHTRIEPVKGTPGQFQITRPFSSVNGADIPLTLVLTGPKPDKVTLGNHPLGIQPGKTAGTWLVELPVTTPAPTKIDWISCGPGFDQPHTSKKFPGIEMDLQPNGDDSWTFEMTNKSRDTMTDIRLAVRLPLIDQQGLYRTALGNLAPGESSKIEIPAQTVEGAPSLRDGAPFAVAEADFTLMPTKDAYRLYVVYRGEADTSPQPCARDAFAVCGPFKPDSLDLEKLPAYSAPGAALTPVDDSPLGQWHTSTPEQRQKYARNRILIVNPTQAWLSAAKAFSRKPATIVAVGEFTLDKEAPVKINSGLPIICAAVDGKTLALSNGTSPKLAAGAHRLLLVLDSQGKLPLNKEKPPILSLSLDGQPVQWLSAPQPE